MSAGRRQPNRPSAQERPAVCVCVVCELVVTRPAVRQPDEDEAAAADDDDDLSDRMP
jgi:hypothetical protein